MIGYGNQIQSGRQGLHIQNGSSSPGLLFQYPTLRIQKRYPVFGSDIDYFYLISDGIGKDSYLFFCGKLVWRTPSHSLSPTSHHFDGASGRSTARKQYSEGDELSIGWSSNGNSLTRADRLPEGDISFHEMSVLTKEHKKIMDTPDKRHIRSWMVKNLCSVAFITNRAVKKLRGVQYRSDRNGAVVQKGKTTYFLLRPCKTKGNWRKNKYFAIFFEEDGTLILCNV